MSPVPVPGDATPVQSSGTAAVPDLRSALETLLCSVERRALRLAELSCPSRAVAIDCVGAAMHDLVAHGAAISPEDWSVCFWRALQRRIALAENASTAPTPREPAAAAARRFAALGNEEALDALEAALRELPLRERQAFLLRVWAGLDVAQTARATERTQARVKTDVFHALQRLGVLLEPGDE